MFPIPFASYIFINISKYKLYTYGCISVIYTSMCTSVYTYVYVSVTIYMH